MRTIAVVGYVPIVANQFGNGQPAQDLPTFESYIAWYRAYFAGAYDPMTQWPQPVYVGSVDSEAGGVFTFAPGDGVYDASRFDVRLEPTDNEVVDWHPCTDFRVLLRNFDYPANTGVQVRQRATSTMAASPVLGNPQAFVHHDYPLEILDYHWEGSVIHMRIKVFGTGCIMPITNGYRHPFRCLFTTGIYDFPFDFTGYEGQRQVISLDGVGYQTPQFQTVVPVAGAPTPASVTNFTASAQ
jgi:hypothetical protein